MGSHTSFLSLKAPNLCGWCSGNSLHLVCTGGGHPQGTSQPPLLMQQSSPSALPSVPFISTLVFRDVASEL